MAKIIRSLLLFLSAISFLNLVTRSNAARADSPALGGAEVYRRTQLVLKTFGVPDEENLQPKLDAVGDRGTPDQITQLIKRLDTSGQFSRFFDLKNLLIKGFAERDTKAFSDLSIGLGSIPTVTPKYTSLNGLKIALDPGHMGSKVWDERTGKFVKDADGKVVSEGKIALQVALLLRTELEKLGAQVMITREDLTSVSPVAYESLDLQAFGKRELRMQSLSGWFQALIHAAPNDTALIQSFKNSSDFKKLFSEVSRSLYFAQRIDLDARVDLIEAFNPDLTIIIHFDAETGGPTVHANGTKAYIPGDFGVDEFSTREERMNFLRIASQPQFSQSSLLLGQSILDQIHDQMGIPYEGGIDGKGIIPRNLSLNRRLPGRTVTYLECSYYNIPDEFYAYLSPDFSMTIGGKTLTYSKRLVQVVNSIRDGVVHFTEL